MRYFPSVRRFRRRGATLVQVTLCLTAVLAVAAVVLDSGLMLTDAAVLAAAVAAALAAAVALADSYGSLTSANPTDDTSAETDAPMSPRSTASASGLRG